MTECSELPPLRGVPFLICQLFYNLTNHSLKFSKEGVPPHVKIEAVTMNNEVAGKEASYIQFLIIDNGIGLKKGYAIFNSFTRLRSKDKHKSTSLCLAFAKTLYKDMTERLLPAAGKQRRCVQHHTSYGASRQHSPMHVIP